MGILSTQDKDPVILISKNKVENKGMDIKVERRVGGIGKLGLAYIHY